MDDDGFAEPGELPRDPFDGKKPGQGCLLIVAVNAVAWSLIYWAVSSWLG